MAPLGAIYWLSVRQSPTTRNPCRASAAGRQGRPRSSSPGGSKTTPPRRRGLWRFTMRGSLDWQKSPAVPEGCASPPCVLPTIELHMYFCELSGIRCGNNGINWLTGSSLSRSELDNLKRPDGTNPAKKFPPGLPGATWRAIILQVLTLAWRLGPDRVPARIPNGKGTPSRKSKKTVRW